MDWIQKNGGMAIQYQGLGNQQERYWGTPLPSMDLQKECGSEHCVGSIEELSEMKTESSEMPPNLNTDHMLTRLFSHARKWNAMAR